ncbi:MAG TPA: pyridoxamine 5'-phosphate oxidase family protein [Acidimicrobiia bacterium]|nr:pyridoxamine 5'-phosphate oxidase family protein [Acidimicrobiia bacterium]
MTPATDWRAELVEIDRSECLRRLGAHAVGRLGIVVHEQPLVFPVNYALDDETVVFRTDPGTKLHGATRGRRVAFEIDGIDPLYHEGWSVLVVGTAEEVSDPHERHQLAHLPLALWGAGPKAHWVRIRPDAITGRRLVHRSD